MIRILLALSALVLLAKPVFADDQQFNLVCAGTKTLLSSPTNRIAGSGKPYSVTFSIDMAKAQFCQTPCRFVETLEEITSDHIKHTDSVSGSLIQMLYMMRIDRTNGHLFLGVYYMMPNRPFNGSEVDADCTKAPFTGFPANSF